MLRYIFVLSLVINLGIKAECLSEVCGAIEGLEYVLINDNLTTSELTDYKQNIKKYIEAREIHYNDLNISNPELEDLKKRVTILDQKISLSTCGETGEIFSGFVDNIDNVDSSDTCYECMNSNIYPVEIERLARLANATERFVVADQVEIKITDDTLNRIMKLCDEGTSANIESCIEKSFNNDIPDKARERLSILLRQRNREPNKNVQNAERMNKLMDDLRGGPTCAKATSLLQHEDGGLTLRDWTLDSNPMVNIELALQECSPVKALELMDRLYSVSGPVPWPWGQKEAMREQMQQIYSAQHVRAHGILTAGMNDIGSAAMGKPVYSCLEQFPPPQMSSNGSVFTLSKIGSFFSTIAGTCKGCMDRTDLVEAKGKCEAFTAEDFQKSREDAAELVAKELIDKNASRHHRSGSDKKFLAEMARDNPSFLGDVLASEGRGCIGHICQAMLDAKEIQRKEDNRAKWRRRGIMVASGATLAIALFAPPSTSVAILAMSGATVGIGVASVISGGIDRASKADQIRALKNKLMGREGNFSAEEWTRLQNLEKEFDRLTIELGVEIGLTMIDIVQLGKLIRNMPEMVDQLRRMKGWSPTKVDDVLRACGVR